MKNIGKKFKIFWIIIFILIIVAILIIKILDDKITPLARDYSISQMKRVVSIIINRSINSDILDKANIDKLFIVTKESSGEIKDITLDSVIVNKINDNISDVCEDNLRLVEEGKYQELKKKFNLGEEYFYIPSGVIFGKTIFNNLGPRIPITFKMIGNVTSGIKTEIKEYGINNSLVIISVEIKVEVIVILPITSDFVSIANEVPITIKLIQGKVPEFYGGTLLK